MPSMLSLSGTRDPAKVAGEVPTKVQVAPTGALGVGEPLSAQRSDVQARGLKHLVTTIRQAPISAKKEFV